MVEAGRVELPSENQFIQLSTSVAYPVIFRFRSRISKASKPTVSNSFYSTRQFCKMFTAKMTSLPVRSPPGLDGLLIKQRKQSDSKKRIQFQKCCFLHLTFKCAFYRGGAPSTRLLHCMVPVEAFTPPYKKSSLNLLFNSPIHLPFCIALCNISTFIIQFFAFAQADLNFHLRTFEIQGKRD